MPSKGLSRMAAFEGYNRFWNKTHSSAAEKNARFLNFMVNAKKIADLNKNSPLGATFGFTKFSDMSLREFKSKMTGFKPKTPINKERVIKRDVEQVPSQDIDWYASAFFFVRVLTLRVAAQKTTPVKNQEQCGSCWAFSATETIESAMLMANQQPQGMFSVSHHSFVFLPYLLIFFYSFLSFSLFIIIYYYLCYYYYYYLLLF
jgi:C1A family cysteine protease